MSPEIAHLNCSSRKNRLDHCYSEFCDRSETIGQSDKVAAESSALNARSSRRRRLRDSRSTTSRDFRHHRQNCAVLLAEFLILVTRVSEVPRCGNDCITHLSSAKSCLVDIVAGSSLEENLRAAAFHGIKYRCVINDVRNLESRSFLLYLPGYSSLSQYRICITYFITWFAVKFTFTFLFLSNI